MSDLSQDVIDEILSFVSTGARCCSLALVSTEWLQAAYTSPALWGPGCLLHNFKWPIGTRVPTILQKHEELDGRREVPHKDINAGPTRYREVVITGLPQMENFCSNFLAGTRVTSVTVEDLRGLKLIANGFLFRCSSLSTVKLSGLHSVTSIPGFFLQGCHVLEHVHLQDLSGVTTIERDFLEGRKFLKTVTLSGFRNAKTIGARFLSNCTSLTALDISGLEGVTTIGNSFLMGCHALEAVDLSGFNRLREVGTSFLCDCQSLAAVDLSALHAVTEINSAFLGCCASLKTIDVSSLSKATSIGVGFLRECSSLTSVEGLGKMKSVVAIRGLFLVDCKALMAVRQRDGHHRPVPVWVRVTHIGGPHWATKCEEDHQRIPCTMSTTELREHESIEERHRDWEGRADGQPCARDGEFQWCGLPGNGRGYPC